MSCPLSEFCLSSCILNIMGQVAHLNCSWKPPVSEATRVLSELLVGSTVAICPTMGKNGGRVEASWVLVSKTGGMADCNFKSEEFFLDSDIKV